MAVGEAAAGEVPGGEVTAGPLAGAVTAMFLLIYSLSAIGDALRDVLDPRVA